MDNTRSRLNPWEPKLFHITTIYRPYAHDVISGGRCQKEVGQSCAPRVQICVFPCVRSIGVSVLSGLMDSCSGPNFMALAGQELNFCASFVSEESLEAWSLHIHKPKFPANLWNTLDISAEFPASVSANTLLCNTLIILYFSFFCNGINSLGMILRPA